MDNKHPYLLSQRERLSLLMHACSMTQLYSILCNPMDCRIMEQKTHQASLSMGFSRQEYWNGLPFPSLGVSTNPRRKPGSPVSPALQADSLPSEPPEKPQRLMCVESGIFPGDLPDSGFKPSYPSLASRFFTHEPRGKPKKDPYL